VPALGQGGDAVERLVEPGRVGPPAVDPDALAEVDQVRRGEEPGAESGLAQHALDHRAGRALAVGAGDMDRAEAALRIAERPEQGARAVEAQLVAPALQAIERLEPALERERARGHRVTWSARIRRPRARRGTDAASARRGARSRACRATGTR